MPSSSMPAAPRLALTCRYASNTILMDMSYGLVDVMGSSSFRVGSWQQPDDATALLHTHYRRFNARTGSSATDWCLGIPPHGFRHLSFPYMYHQSASRVPS